LPEVFDLRSYLQDQVALLRTLAQRKGLDLELELGESLPYRVYGDATRIGQVIYNLASNAIKFTDQGGVRLEVAFLGRDQLEVKVSDTGPGIAPEEQERVFGAFVQAGGVEKRKEGSGLGLRICRELARLMGGDVALDSTLGKGSVFTFTARLPAAEQQSVDDLAQDAVGEGTATDDVDQELEVVVAEDDPSNALLLCELLKRLGCRPVHVENGLDALERWRYSNPDLLLLDLQMPGADGRTVACQVRQIEAEQGRRRTAVAILTAYPPSALEEVCEQVDCDQLLYKPIDKQALKGVLDGVRKRSGKACKDVA
jgi:CheY-like chemotaxis protein/anti-sigma regulatory factor (Ser/Thr protein kinase)